MLKSLNCAIFQGTGKKQEPWDWGKKMKKWLQTEQWSKKNAVQLSGASGFSFLASDFSFPFARLTRDQASCLRTKSLKEETKTCPGQAKCESFMSQGQAGIQVFWFPSPAVVCLLFKNSTFSEMWNTDWTTTYVNLSTNSSDLLLDSNEE